MGSQTLAVGPPDPAGDVTAVLNAIRRIVRALRLSGTAAERVLGVSGAQLFVLQQLEAASRDAPRGLSIAEIAARTATDPSSVSVVITRLVERGLCARRASREDARRAEVAITAAGRAVLRRAPEPIQARLVGAIATLPDAELHAVAVGLSRVVAAMGVEGGEVPMFFEEDSTKRKTQRRRQDERASTR